MALSGSRKLGAAPRFLEPLKATQKIFYKLMLNIPKFNHDHSYMEIFKRVNIPTLNERQIYLSMSIGHNILIKGAFDRHLMMSLKIPTYSSRSRELFTVPFYRLDTSRRFFNSVIPKIFNQLPGECDPFNLYQDIPF